MRAGTTNTASTTDTSGRAEPAGHLPGAAGAVG